MAVSKSGRQTMEIQLSGQSVQIGNQFQKGEPSEQHRKEQHLSAGSFTALNVHFVQKHYCDPEGCVLKEASHIRHSKPVLPYKCLNVLEKEELW